MASLFSYVQAGADTAAKAAQAAIGSSFTFLTEDHITFPYLKYTVRTFYRWNPGTLQIPVAVANPTPTATSQTSVLTTYRNNVAASILTDTQVLNPQVSIQTQPPIQMAQRAQAEIVQTSAPYGQKMVVIEAQRIGAIPQLPDPVSANPNQVLADSIILLTEPQIVPDMQSRLFEVQATYLYWLYLPIWVPDGFNQLPINKADGNSRTNYTLSSDNFIKGLI